MIDWPVAELGDHVDMQIGFPFKSAKFLDQSDNAVRLLRGDNIGQGLLRWDGAKHWPEAEVEAVASYHVDQGDVILAMDRPWIEAGLKFAYVRPSDMPCLLVQRVARMRGTATLETDYLRHVIASPAFTAYVKSITTGVNVPHISGKDIKKFRFPLPPLPAQRRIASILGAYDDLIEVNRRRIAVLEEMARGLFEEWFVRFRFPGHEAVPILDTPGGPLPEGWISQTVGDTFELLGGGTPSKAEPNYWTDGTIDWFTPSDLTKSKTLFMDRSGDRITPLGLAKSSAKLFPADSIMMTSRATIGEISICTGPASTNQGFITCLPNDAVPRSYLYFWLLQNVPLFIAHATGATFKEITKGVFKRLPITVPRQPISAQFDEQVRPMHDMILVLERSNRSLAASRDLLLPRLISGQLTVAEATRELEEAA